MIRVANRAIAASLSSPAPSVPSPRNRDRDEPDDGADDHYLHYSQTDKSLSAVVAVILAHASSGGDTKSSAGSGGSATGAGSALGKKQGAVRERLREAERHLLHYIYRDVLTPGLAHGTVDLRERVVRLDDAWSILVRLPPVTWEEAKRWGAQMPRFQGTRPLESILLAELKGLLIMELQSMVEHFVISSALTPAMDVRIG